MTRTRNMSDLLDSGGDVKSGALDNVPASNDASALTTGTLPDGRFPATLPAVSGANLTGVITDIVGDTTPQLGGDLDLNSSDITGTGNINITGNVTLSGTVDGRDVAADGTKLDGVEASADVTDTTNVVAALTAGSDISIAADGTIAYTGAADVQSDTSPQLGGSLDVNGNSIVSVSNGDISITPNGTGSVIIDGLSHPQADGSAGQFLKTDGSGNLSFATVSQTLAALSVTATASELNVLDGITATTAELNIMDGVTATASELNILDGVTATTAELNIMDGVTATTAELNKMDGVTASTTEINYLDGVTSNIQTQINNAGPPAVNSAVSHSTASQSGSSGNYNVASVTITPSSTSARILLIATTQVYAGGNAATFYARIRRGSSNVSSTHYSSLSNYGKYEAIACCEIDQPGSTSTQTYHINVGWSGGSGSASYPQHANASICAVEIH